MSGTNLAIVRKNSTLMTFMSDFMKNKGVVNEWAFVWTNVDKEPTDRIFAKFFAKKPKVKLSFIDKHAAAARRIFAERVAKAREEGAENTEIVAKAVNAEEFKTLLKNAQRYVREQFEQRIMPQFASSSYYKNYVGTQVDGSALASKLNFPATAGQHLADAKVNLILKDKGRAMSCIKLAVDVEAKARLKAKGPRDRTGFKEIKPADLLKQLDKLKVDVYGA